jgi:hypothetical protein
MSNIHRYLAQSVVISTAPSVANHIRKEFLDETVLGSCPCLYGAGQP